MVHTSRCVLTIRCVSDKPVVGCLPEERGSSTGDLRRFRRAPALIHPRVPGTVPGKVANRSGCTRNQVSNLERNHSNRDPYIADPQLSTIYRLALALRAAAWLLPDIDRPVQRRSPEQASNKAVSVVEAELGGCCRAGSRTLTGVSGVWYSGFEVVASGVDGRRTLRDPRSFLASASGIKKVGCFGFGC